MVVAAVDFIIIAFMILAAFMGWRQGFVVGAVTAAALVGGSILSTRVVPRILENGEQSQYTPLVGLAGGLFFAALIAGGMQDVAAWAREKYMPESAEKVDSGLGSVFAIFLSLALVWLTAATIVSLPALRDVRPAVFRSQIVQKLNTTLPPSSVILNTISRYDPFPTIRGPQILIDPPDGSLPKAPAVRQAADSVVRVVGTACGFGVTGSGWVVDDELVVTNAHVVAGSDDTAVQSLEERRGLDAKLVYMDGKNDVAILRVPGLNSEPLTIAEEVIKGSAGVILGYPENGPFDSKPARIGGEETVRADDAFARQEVLRDVTTFRGNVRHGNSGGPVVDEQGRVLATVFASAVGTKVQGGYGVPNDIVRDAVAVAGTSAVSSGDCIS